MPPGLLAQRKGCPRTILGYFYCFGNETIFGKSLILRTSHQRFVNEPEANSRVAFDGIWIECIKGTKRALPNYSSFRCLWIHVIEMSEFRIIFWGAMHRDCVRRDNFFILGK